MFSQADDIHPKLKAFIVDYCTRYKIRKVDPQTLSLDTSIDLDLDIFDIEIDLFLTEFVAEFHIDKSKFSWYKYGYPKGSISAHLIKAVFGHQSPWVKRLSILIYKPRFRISNLQEAVNTGKLI
jgi:hypothetical protein